MRGVLMEQFGEPAEVLQVRDLPVPAPGPGEVAVRMLASPVNPSDVMTIRGKYPRLPLLPATPGYEGVGIVMSSGGGLLGRLIQGKRVAVLAQNGGNWRQMTVIPAKSAIPLPKALSTNQGAMFFVNPATAYIITRRIFAVPPGEWLLQTAAGSALGRMVQALGNRFGFRTLNVVRRPEQQQELQSRGEVCVTFDPAREPPEALRSRVLELTNGAGVKYAMDPVGGSTASAAVRCLAAEGRLIVYGSLDDGPLSFSPRDLMSPGASIEGFWLGNWMAKQSLWGKLKLVRTLSKLLVSGVMESEIAATYPLEEVAEGVAASERPARGGKILLRIADA